MRYAIACCAALLLAACISKSNPNARFSVVRSEPMGSNQYIVSCVDRTVYCAREANRLCPVGMDIVSTTGSAIGNQRLTMVIKCTPKEPAPTE
jgi:hypothetical protein